MECSKGSCDHASLMCEIKVLREEKQRLEDLLDILNNPLDSNTDDSEPTQPLNKST